MPHIPYTAEQATEQLLRLAKTQPNPPKAKVEELLAANPNLDALDERGNGLLELALEQGSTTLFRRLLECGADPNLISRESDSDDPASTPSNPCFWQTTPLRQAVVKGMPAQAQQLIAFGAEVNTRFLGVSNTPDMTTRGEIPQGTISLLALAAIDALAAQAMGEDDKNASSADNMMHDDSDQRKLAKRANDIVALLLESGAFIDEQESDLMNNGAVAARFRQAKNRMAELANQWPNIVDTLAAEDICLAANLGMQDRLFSPTVWVGKAEKLTELLVELPIWLSNQIMQNNQYIGELHSTAYAVPKSQVDSALAHAEPLQPAPLRTVSQ